MQQINNSTFITEPLINYFKNVLKYIFIKYYEHCFYQTI